AEPRRSVGACQIYEKLICRMDVESRSGLDLRPQGQGGFLPNAFGGLPAFREGIGSEKECLRLGPEDQGAALPNRLLSLVHPLFDLDVRNAVEAADGRVLHPLRDVLGEVRGVCDPTHPPNVAALRLAERRPAPSWLEYHLDDSPASRCVPTSAAL